MKKPLLGMLVMFVGSLLTSVVSLLLLPSTWTPVFASVAGVAGLGLGVTGYAIRKQ